MHQGVAFQSPIASGESTEEAFRMAFARTAEAHAQKLETLPVLVMA